MQMRGGRSMLEGIFGQEMPIALRFAILAGVAAVVLPIAVIVFKALFGRANDDLPYAAPISSSFGIARIIIWIAEKLALLFVLITTVLGAVLGATYLRIWVSFVSPRDADTYTWVGGFLGGMAALTMASLLTGLLFTLAEIERNTRRTAAMLESMRR
jgi:hypothetical protein